MNALMKRWAVWSGGGIVALFNEEKDAHDFLAKLENGGVARPVLTPRSFLDWLTLHAKCACGCAVHLEGPAAIDTGRMRNCPSCGVAMEWR